MATKKAIPKRIYVVREYDGADSYLVAHESADGLASAGESVRAAVFEFVENVTITAPIKVS